MKKKNHIKALEIAKLHGLPSGSPPCHPFVYCEADLKKCRSIKAEQGGGVFRFALKDGRKTRKIELTDDEAWVIGEMISAMHPRTLGSSNPLWHRIQEQRQIILDGSESTFYRKNYETNSTVIGV